MLKRPHYIALSLVLVRGTGLFLNLPRPNGDPVQTGSGQPFPALVRPGRLRPRPRRASWQFPHPAARPPDSTRATPSRKQPASASARPRSTEVWRENERLREALNSSNKSPGNSSSPASSCAIRPTGGAPSRSTSGKRDGVVADMPVLDAGRAVGRQSQQVGASTARVALVGDPDCRRLGRGRRRRCAGLWRHFLRLVRRVLDGSVVELTYVNQPRVSKAGPAGADQRLGRGLSRQAFSSATSSTPTASGSGFTPKRASSWARTWTDLEEVWVVLP